MQGKNFVLQQLVGHRYAGMLTQMRNPGFDRKHLDEPSMVFDILEKSPLNGTVAAASYLQFLHQQIKSSAIRIVDTILQRYQHGAMIVRHRNHRRGIGPMTGRRIVMVFAQIEFEPRRDRNQQKCQQS